MARAAAARFALRPFGLTSCVGHQRAHVASRMSESLGDPIHGFVPLTSCEHEIVLSRDFQRLDRIRQLGSFFFVYPGGVHTHFAHSIGTLAVSQALLEHAGRETPVEPCCVIRPVKLAVKMLKAAEEGVPRVVEKAREQHPSVVN